MASIFDKIKTATPKVEEASETVKPAAKPSMFANIAKPKAEPSAEPAPSDEVNEDSAQPDTEVTQEEATEAAATPITALAQLGNKAPVVANDSTSGIKPNFGPVTKTSGANDVFANIELPPNPSPDASPAEITEYYLAKMNAVGDHLAAGRNVLAELHTHLAENPETKDLLLPEHLGQITYLMEGLTRRAHVSAQTRKATSQAKTAKKEVTKEKTNAVVAGMGNILG